MRFDQDSIQHTRQLKADRDALIELQATQKAKEYNNMYHGLFIHALYVYNVQKFLSTKGEASISTVRSNTTVGDIHNQRDCMILIGFGHITKLYDWDVMSSIGNDGNRISSTIAPQSTHLHNVDYNNFQHVDYYDDIEFKQELYYDEGFMRMETADIILVVVPDASNIETTRAKNLIRKYFPYSKFITTQQFDTIKTSEELLRLVYKTKQERDTEEIRSGELGMYDEKILPTFKEYLLSK